jgi:YVTN family beta-propeller protein
VNSIPKPAPVLGLLLVLALLTACSRGSERAVDRPPGVVNLYQHTTANDLSPAVADALYRVYVPDVGSGDLYVIDPNTDKVVDHDVIGGDPQHVIPSWDLKTLWVAGSSRGRRFPGRLTSIDPATAKITGALLVPDAYNLYFTPDGSAAVVVAESRRRLEYRDPHTMKYLAALDVPKCRGINHADYSPRGRYAIFTCEFSGGLAKVDVAHKKVLGYLKLARGGMPQDIRISPDGSLFYVANMLTDGVSLIDGNSFREVGFIPTGIGAHGLYPSRDGTKLYVSNRGSHKVDGPSGGPGSVSVIDFKTRRVEQTWPVLGGGSPDMGNVSADGKHLWLSGRFDRVVYDIDTRTGAMKKIPVGRSPHGLTVWPQPGRFSLGHTGVMR